MGYGVLSVNQGRIGRQADFENAITNAKIDFSKENLVFLRHTETSGSVRIDFHLPVIENEKLISRIDRIQPQIGTADMAYYCYAVAFSKKSGVTEVELRVPGKKTIVLPI